MQTLADTILDTIRAQGYQVALTGADGTWRLEAKRDDWEVTIRDADPYTAVVTLAMMLGFDLEE